MKSVSNKRELSKKKKNPNATKGLKEKNKKPQSSDSFLRTIACYCLKTMQAQSCSLRSQETTESSHLWPPRPTGLLSRCKVSRYMFSSSSAPGRRATAVTQFRKVVWEMLTGCKVLSQCTQEGKGFVQVGCKCRPFLI